MTDFVPRLAPSGGELKTQVLRDAMMRTFDADPLLVEGVRYELPPDTGEVTIMNAVCVRVADGAVLQGQALLFISRLLGANAVTILPVAFAPVDPLGIGATATFALNGNVVETNVIGVAATELAWTISVQELKRPNFSNDQVGP